MKKILSLFLSILMAVNIFSVTVFAEETGEQSLEDIIRPQVEAFAKSIDQKDAAGKAADAIATHGMFGRGKDLKVNESHALTALLVNSELAQKCISALCAEMIETKDELDLDAVYGASNTAWRIKGNNFYRYFIYDYDYNLIIGSDNEIYEPSDYVKSSDYYVYYKTANGYDEELEWIVGGCGAKVSIKASETYMERIVYDVNVGFVDYFNFSTSSGSGFQDFISGIGALLFKEFYWYSDFDFQIEIPNECEHSFSEWKQTKAPTYFEEGEEQRTCSSCGATEKRTVPALEYLFGDVNGDEKINVLDANLVRKYAAKSVELSEKQLAAADTNGDGKLNILDANLIRKFSAKIIDSFPATK